MRELARNRHTPVIEIRFQLLDPRRRLSAVRLAHQLGDRLPHAFVRRGRSWELSAAAPDVARFEYQLELIDQDDESEWILDPANPRKASGPWGDKSVWESPGYEPPAWIDGARCRGEAGHDPEPDPPRRAARADLGPSGRERRQPDARRPRRAGVRRALGAPAPPAPAAAAPRDADRAGRPERDLLRVGPLRARARRRDPPLAPAAPLRIGLGASLGALALFHAHRRYSETFDALFLQSGSFFRRKESYERWFPRYERIARFVGGVHRSRPERAIPLVLACGTVEENLAANRALAESLAARGYDVRLHEFRDGHNWVAWRDSFQPHLQELLERMGG